jgi:tetratricopeptide (TPR) repeat protein
MSKRFALPLVLPFLTILVIAQQNAGDHAISRQDWATAVTYFQKAVASDPKDGLSWFQLGTALHGQKHYAEAAQAFEKAFDNDYAAPRSLFHEAVEYAQLNDTEKAFDAITRLTKLGFMNVSALTSDEGLTPLHNDPRWQKAIDAAQYNATPCERTVKNRQFDFWIGDWDVQTKDGHHAGDSKIQKILNGCALFENWEGGGPGKSINSYNTVRKQWQQLWVDASGEVHEYAGNLVNGEMILEGLAADHDGNQTMKRMTFTQLPGGRVKQKGETSSDGKTWTTEYELIYIPKNSASATSGR